MNKINEKAGVEVLKEEMLNKYPPKVARKRSKSMVAVKGISENGEFMSPEVQANVRTIPGIITQRGCCYAGCKGVVLGPTRDILHLVHGPVGCSYYSWLTRRNQTRPRNKEDDNFMAYCFSTDMQEREVVFGGEKKLRKAVEEAYELFRPKAIAIFSTCPVGLIGDDVHAVSREMREKFNINVFAFSCEGYKGVSQSAGHHIANNTLFSDVVGTDDNFIEGKFRINLLGEYNIGGDSFEIERIFRECGITLVSTFSGNSEYDDLARSHTAELNLVMCHRSINYMAEMMEKKYGIPWFKINFIGAEATAKSLRKIAQYFEDEELISRVEEVIEKELKPVKDVLNEVYPGTENKTAMLFVGGSRAHHYQELFGELGMPVISAGYEFAHRDDYEGRKILSSIKVDADSRNIEELHVDADPLRYRARKSEEELNALEKKGISFGSYEGMIPDMSEGSFVVDDVSHYEMEKLIEIYKPSIFCAGIKEKYVVQKMGVPLKQLHSYDYGGPYAGFSGAINFYREIDRMVNTKIWNYLQAPWDKNPELRATYADVS